MTERFKTGGGANWYNHLTWRPWRPSD